MVHMDADSLDSTSAQACSLRQLLTYFVKLGTFGFGGPIALTGAMQRDLVDRHRWISLQEYKEGLALSQLAPGPLAAQLAIYLGRTRFGVFGATLVAFAFILPSLLMVLGLAALYLRDGGLAWMQGVFYGVGAAVIAIIARSAWKLAKSTLGSKRLAWALFLITAGVTVWTESEIVWLFISAGFVAVAARMAVHPRSIAVSSLLAATPPWLWSGLGGPAPDGLILRIFLYFAEAGAFVFGSGLAIVPFLHGGVVTQFHWLTERQFLDAVAVAMITPGPVVITVAFIGYLVAGLFGGLSAALGVFLPCYLFVILPAPYFRRIAKNPWIAAFVEGVTAAATGAIAGAAIVLGRRAITDLPTILISVATLLVLLKARGIPEPVVIVAAGLLGLLLRQP
jgi:chromate transporter